MQAVEERQWKCLWLVGHDEFCYNDLKKSHEILDHNNVWPDGGYLRYLRLGCTVDALGT